MRPNRKGRATRLGFFLVSLVCFSHPLFASGIDEGDQLFKAGHYAEAADRYYTAYTADPKGSHAAEALVKTGRALDLAKKGLYEASDAKCYLNKHRDQANPECFEADVAALNRRFGEGSFSYHGDQVQFAYNATHFKKVLDDFPNSPYREEASLMMLRGSALLGDDPDEVCKKVEDWLAAYPKSALRPKALLLLGRLRADAFVTFKSGGFITVDGKVDPEATTMVRTRQQAKGLAAFKEVMDKYGSSSEASAAKREYDLLKEGKDDGISYGISY